MQNHKNGSIKKIAPIAVSAFAALMLLGAASQQAFAVAFLSLDCDLTPSNSQGACGWVGKGEVQNAYSPSLNNKQLQDIATSVDFKYEEEATYDITIQFTTDDPSAEDEGDNCEPNPNENPRNPNDNFICTRTHEATQTKITSVDATVSADPRKSPNQFTGFKLTSATVTTSGDEIPEVGNVEDYCTNGPNDDCTVIDVQQTGSGDSTFYATSSLGNSNPISVSIQ